MRIGLVMMLYGLFVQDVNAADIYRWVDHNGVVNYSDEAPFGIMDGVQQRNLTANVIDSQDSYATKIAAMKHPVVLFSSDCGPLCREARALLDKRGVPYTYKDVQTDPAAAATLKQLSGGARIPVLKIGDHLVKGFETEQWNAALDNADYPKEALHRTHRNDNAPAPVTSARPSGNGAHLLAPDLSVWR